jgi:DNA-binding MarR family transcriptional regulator
MSFETSLTYSLSQLANNFRYNFDLKMNEINLYGGQVFILFSLWNNNGQSQIDLAKNLNLSAPTINKMVKSLASSGFIECYKCQNDGRMMRVQLTQKGVQHQKLFEEKFVEFETDFFSNLTETERLILLQIFVKINSNFIKRNSLNKTT